MILLDEVFWLLCDVNVNVVVIGIGKEFDSWEFNFIIGNLKVVEIILIFDEVIVNVYLLSK